MTADHLGSPRIITDDDKDVVSRHDYLAFGDEVTETVGNVAGRTSGQGYGSQDEIRKQYTGYERDKESGLDFAQARYYNSKKAALTHIWCKLSFLTRTSILCKLTVFFKLGAIL